VAKELAISYQHPLEVASYLSECGCEVVEMNNVTLQNLVFDVLHSSPCRTEVDFIGYEERVRFLMENLIIKFDQDLEYQRDLEEQIDNLEVENIGLDKCIRRLSKDATEAIDECRSEADGMAEKMISTVKLLQSENVQWQVIVCCLLSYYYTATSILTIRFFTRQHYHVYKTTIYSMHIELFFFLQYSAPETPLCF
jgi:hypothetical protein